MPDALDLPVGAEALIPHRPPMRLVDRLVAFDGQAGVVEARVAADGLLVDADGHLAPVAAVEFLAQAFAAVKGYADRLQGLPVKRGFLVGSRRVRLFADLRAGDRLEIAVRTVGTLEGFAVAEGEILRDGERVAAGTVKLWVPEEPPPPLQGEGVP